MAPPISTSAFYHRVGLLPALATAAACLITCGVAGKSLGVVKAAYKTAFTQNQLDVPSTGEPAIFISIAATCLCVPICIVVLAVRLCSLRRNPTLVNSVGPMAIIYLNIFAGIFIVAGFGGAGMLAAISASAWFDCGNAVASIDTDTDSEVAELLCYEAARWLIGTSISSFVAFLVNNCFIVAEMVLHFMKATNGFQSTRNTKIQDS